MIIEQCFRCDQTRHKVVDYSHKRLEGRLVICDEDLK